MREEKIIKGTSQHLLQHGDIFNGACVEISLAYAKYLKEKHGIILEIHQGWLIDGEKKVPHLWSSYKDKSIDLTSHKQDGLSVKPIILKDATLNRVVSSDLPSHFTVEEDPLTTEWLFEYMELWS